MPAERHGDAIIEAAWGYYHDGLTQNQLAERLGVSRASVVNYLAEARRRGLVRVTLDSEAFLAHALADRLKRRFGLTAALVAPADPSDPARTADRVARAAADWLPQLLAPGDRLGVAWGETIYRVAEAAPRLALDDLTVVQLLGALPASSGFAPEICSATLARRFGARCVNLHVPLMLSDEALARRLRAEPSVAQALASVARCNKTIFAAGGVDDDSHMARTGLVGEFSLAAFRDKGAAGVICARFIDGDGAAAPAAYEARMIGVTLDQMRAKAMKLLVAMGESRVNAARAALIGGFATHLATSADIAAQLLAAPAPSGDA